VDLVIVEGFKRDGHPKIEVHRCGQRKPWLHPDAPRDPRRGGRRRRRPARGLPFVRLDDIAGVAESRCGHARTVESCSAGLTCRCWRSSPATASALSAAP
jgi:molybdopterin-guanine dinucleotide biosynthesis protein B